MKDLKIEEYNISHMTVTNDIISWEGHVLRVPSIVRIWTADAPKKPFPFNMVLILLMVALSCSRTLNLAVMLVILAAYVLVHVLSHKANVKSRNHVNLELYNGTIYSFLAGGEAFAEELYQTLKNLLAAETDRLHYEILFEDGGKIIDPFKPVRPADPADPADVAETDLLAELEQELKWEQETDSAIMRELKKLHTRCIEKTDIDQEILELINEARNLTIKNDRDGLKSVFGRFVTFGLINDCNELGLDCLLQEIKSAIY